MLSILDYPDREKKEKRARERAHKGGREERDRKGNGREKEEIDPEGETRETTGGAEEVCVVVVSCKVNYSKDLEREQSRRRQ